EDVEVEGRLRRRLDDCCGGFHILVGLARGGEVDVETIGVDILVVVRVGFGLETDFDLVEGLGQIVGERLRLVEAALDDLQRLNGFGFGLGSIGRLTAAGTECQDRGNREGWNELRNGLHGPQPIGVRRLLSSRVRRLWSEPAPRLYAHRLRFRSLWAVAEVSPFGVGPADLELPAEPESLEQVRLCSELLVRDEDDAVESPLLSDPFFQFGQHGLIYPRVHLPLANPVIDGRVDIRPLPRASGCRDDLSAAE